MVIVGNPSFLAMPKSPLPVLSGMIRLSTFRGLFFMILAVTKFPHIGRRADIVLCDMVVPFSIFRLDKRLEIPDLLAKQILTILSSAEALMKRRLSHSQATLQITTPPVTCNLAILQPNFSDKPQSVSAHSN